MSGEGGPIACARGDAPITLTPAEVAYGAIVHAVDAARDIAGERPMGMFDRFKLAVLLRDQGISVSQADLNFGRA